ncbi:P1 family peptidase [Piscibacillus halophilus]|uniref:DmpA family aminopeptidase n=1 Tax=Piscibacillus halophilus TaxID=571933 RepID=UPI00158AB030|nr:P1 family peptidase [Piscibacillus halophilus]
MVKRIRDIGVEIGALKTGKLNKITDVEGVKVGHYTVKHGDLNTGVTAVLPHEGNLFTEKVMGATYVINGFGKTVGTVQIDELGTIETPILLTNTLNVGACSEAIVEYTLNQNPEIGRTTGTVNPVVGECNDMMLNDIREMAVTKENAKEAIHEADVNFKEGAVGAGTGMKCFGLKGGIGSSSRIIEYPHGHYTIGVLVLSNFGQLKNFHLNGKHIGPRIQSKLGHLKSEPDKGSIMVIVATDLPVTERQLKRVIKRSSVGIARTGSFYGNGSGDLVIGFSTANKIPHDRQNELQSFKAIHEEDIDQAFQAVADATEEAILNSMVAAKTMTGRSGNTLYSLSEFLSFE